MKVKLPTSWQAVLGDELKKPYFKELAAFVDGEREKHTVFPPEDDVFSAFELTPYDRVGVVLIGQDPYHDHNQAHGLCFSVRHGVRTPPSLVNIYKELNTDLGIPPARHGFLESWAKQGVLLLNSVLTVERGLAASHQGRGWERFTDAIIRAVNEADHPVVFMLWGSYAQKKAAFVDRSRHLVLRAPHPSPLSAHSGFLGCRHFSQANAFLESKGMAPIDWALPECAVSA